MITLKNNNNYSYYDVLYICDKIRKYIILYDYVPNIIFKTAQSQFKTVLRLNKLAVNYIYFFFIKFHYFYNILKIIKNARFW